MLYSARSLEIPQGEVLIDPVKVLLGYCTESNEVYDLPIYQTDSAELTEFFGETPTGRISHNAVLQARERMETVFGVGVIPADLQFLLNDISHMVFIGKNIQPLPIAPDQYQWGTLQTDGYIKGKGPRMFRSMLRSYKKGDATPMEKALTKLESWWSENKLPEPALDFKVPSSWVEIGIEDHARMVFHDTQVLGRKAASFYMGPRRMGVGGLVYCSGPVDLRNIFDAYRQLSGLEALPRTSTSPLPNELEIERKLVLSMAVEVKADLPHRGLHELLVAWTDQAGTWILTLRGPESVAVKERSNFAAFARSIKTGERETVLAWLPD